MLTKKFIFDIHANRCIDYFRCGGGGQITHTLLVVGLNVGTDGTSGGAFWQN